MIEILNKKDIEKVKDEKIKNYLYQSFDRLPHDFIYPKYGYFIIIENLQEIKNNSIDLSIATLNSFDDGLYSDINMVEIIDGIVEILVFIDNDVSVSLIMLEDVLDKSIIYELNAFII